jgi:hypothetical protein
MRDERMRNENEGMSNEPPSVEMKINFKTAVADAVNQIILFLNEI